jgi:L-serine deaminase
MVSGAIGAGLAVGGAIFNANENKKAGKKAKKLARKNEEFERFELAESLRRLDITQEQQRGQQVAVAGASGFDIKSGSISKFLKEQKEQQQLQRDFTQQQGERGIQIGRQSGQNAKDAADSAAVGSFIGGAAGAATSLSGGFQNLQTARASNPNVKWWQV